jgi:addiction module HigA family antidote
MKNLKLSNGLPAIHPSELLREMLRDMGLTEAAFANAIGISVARVTGLLKEQRPVTAELALRLGRAFGQSPQYWLNLQTAFDLKLAQAKLKNSLLAVKVLTGVKTDD